MTHRNDYQDYSVLKENEFLGILNRFGETVGISEEELPNGSIRYRKQDVEGTPGVWISKQEACKELKQARFFSIQDLTYHPRPLVYDLESAVTPA